MVQQNDSVFCAVQPQPAADHATCHGQVVESNALSFTGEISSPQPAASQVGNDGSIVFGERLFDIILLKCVDQMLSILRDTLILVSQPLRL